MRFSSLPFEQMQAWSYMNNVKFNGIQIRAHVADENGGDKGGGIIAQRDHDSSDILLIVPRDLILNKAYVEDAARSDRFLREVLAALGPTFLQTSRIAIMVYLLLQFTYSSSSNKDGRIGVTSPMTDYVRFLPESIPLPTLYTDDERELLLGTSLDIALDQKLKRLQEEFDLFRSATQQISWCQELWWDEEEGVLDLTEWKKIDAIYRSRALELPLGVGDSMVPILDMTNHRPDGKHNARFQLDDEGNVQLAVRDDTVIRADEEVSIMYGCGGACEMIFSYGFLDADAQSAREIFLNLELPDDDPLKRAKIEFAKEASGVRIYNDNKGQMKWESSFVWWACVNQEDGLEFEILRQNDGSVELQATWNGTNFAATDLERTIMADQLRDVFMLRATVLVQERVETQGIELSLPHETRGARTQCGCSGPIVDTIGRLRDLEMEMLAASYQSLEVEKARLLESDIVREYLNRQDPDQAEGDGEDLS